MAHRDVTGRKSARSDQAERVLPEKAAHSIEEFCYRHGISRAHYYNLRRLGHGPREMHAHGRKLISVEAQADWRRACEADESRANRRVSRFRLKANPGPDTRSQT